MKRKAFVIIGIAAWLASAAVSCSVQAGSPSADTEPSGELDPDFDPGTGLNQYGMLFCMAGQNDGKIVIGGAFTGFDGTGINHLARLNADGSLDTGFNTGTGPDSYVTCLALQDDGKIVIGGNFTSYNGTAMNYLARVNEDGSLDDSFDIGTGAQAVPATPVACVAAQDDGGIIVGGAFNCFDNIYSNTEKVVRLHANGSLDTDFNSYLHSYGMFDDSVVCAAALSDGKMIIGGGFTSPSVYVARVNANGLIDTPIFTGLNDAVSCVAPQNDGKMVCGGVFTEHDGTSRIRIARFNEDKTLDTSFDPGTGANAPILCLSVQQNGKIVMGGAFSYYASVPINGIARLNADGSLDSSFTPGVNASGVVYCAVIQRDGKIIIGGYFSSCDGVARSGVARIK